MPSYCGLWKRINCYGVGQAQLWGRERLILVRAMDGVMCMEVLHFHTQIRDRAELLGNLHLPAVSKAELSLASKLDRRVDDQEFQMGTL